MSELYKINRLVDEITNGANDECLRRFADDLATDKLPAEQLMRLARTQHKVNGGVGVEPVRTVGQAAFILTALITESRHSDEQLMIEAKALCARVPELIEQCMTADVLMEHAKRMHNIMYCEL